MAEEPEVIQSEMDETRHALAEKLELIGTKISGTVESVTETVNNVTETVEGTVQTVADAVSGTVESVKDTVEAVGEKASETVEAVKHAFNLTEQVQARPWLWFGGSVAVGFVAGKLLGPRGSHTPQAESFSRGQGYYERPQESAQPSTGNGYGWSQDQGTTSSSQAADTGSSQSSSWLGSLFQNFGGEIDKLKGLALGTLFGVARDMVSQSLPESLKDQVVHLFNDVTEKAGGQTLRGPVLGESDAESSGSDQESAASRGAEDDQSSSSEMDRPMGAAERKGKAAVAKPHRR
jgi:ElaB/YqjD/DUF883 family membrane-anchored ribosome-binding protein